MGFLSCLSPLLPALASSNASSIADPLLYDKSAPSLLLDEKHAVLELERADDGTAAAKLELLRGEMEKFGVDV